MERLFWLDMEMTGLIPEKDRILEVAAIVTDLEFRVLDTLETVVFQPAAVLEGMDAWCQFYRGCPVVEDDGLGLVAVAHCQRPVFGIARQLHPALRIDLPALVEGSAQRVQVQPESARPGTDTGTTRCLITAVRRRHVDRAGALVQRVQHPGHPGLQVRGDRGLRWGGVAR